MTRLVFKFLGMGYVKVSIIRTEIDKKWSKWQFVENEMENMQHVLKCSCVSGSQCFTGA